MNHTAHSRRIGRIRILILLPLLFLAISAGCAHAQPLDTLVRRAFERHPSLESFRLAADRAERRADAAAAWEPPRAGVEISMLPPRNPNPFSKGETMFMVEQEIPLFGQNRRMEEAMRLGGDIARQDLQGTMLEIRARIESEYYRMILLDQQMRLNRENRALADVLYDNVEAVYGVTDMSQADLYSIAVEIERLDAELRTLQIKRQTVQAELNALLLQPTDDTVIVTGELPAEPLPPFDVLVKSLETNPELKKMEAMAAMNEAEAMAEESMLDPMLMLRGGVAVMPEGHPVRMAELGEMVDQLHASGANDVERLGLMVGAMISIPIAPWSRSGPEARAEAARLEGKEALAQRDAMRQEMIAMLRREHGMAQTARVWIEHYRDRQIPLLEQTLSTQRNDYMNGRASITALLETYRMLVMAREEIAMREAEYATALAQIKRMTGE